jgi:hypothetical protein
VRCASCSGRWPGDAWGCCPACPAWGVSAAPRQGPAGL